MTEGWNRKKLKEIGEIQTGTTPSTRIKEYYGNYIPFIKPPHFNKDGSINHKSIGLSKEGLIKGRLVKENSVLMVCIGATIGKTGITYIPVSCNQQINAFTPTKDHDPKFFYYLMNSPLFFNKVIENSSQATLPMINKSKWQNIEVSFPPLPEQKKIVALLDATFAKIDQAKANIEKNIANTKELFQSKLNAIFSQKGEGWEENSLENLITIKHGFAFKSKFFTTEGDYVLLTPGNYYENGGYKDRGKKQKYYQGEIPSGFILKKGDLLVAMTEQAPGLLGSPLIVPESNRFLHNQRLGLVKVKEGKNLLNEFLFFLFNTTHLRREVFKSGTGVKVRHTSPTKIGNVKVNISQNEEIQRKKIKTLKLLLHQKEILIAKYKKKTSALEELKKSLLQKAFSGELTT